jgi:hypothetical protein
MIVGGHEILREIGHGGMATVYLARQLELDRLTALKELGGLNRPDPSFARRFVREARMAGSLSHPNIVTVYDYLAHEGTPYIAMEYLARGSLRPHVGGVSLAQLGGVLESLLAGLSRAHADGIVHRDLKPENLLVADDGRIKIADFGIATVTDELRFASRITVTGTTIGTPEYMAPEQAMGKAVGPATDLYSVGMIALELATGRLPFDEEESQIAVLMRQIKQPTPSARKLDPDVDPAISDWIERMVVKDPARRPPSATLAWTELEEILIERLGARWRRDAPLALPVGDAGLPDEAAAATPSTAPMAIATTPLAPLAATILPSRPVVAAAPRPPRARVPLVRRVTRVRRTLLAAVLVGGLAFAALGGGGTGATPSAPAGSSRSGAGLPSAAGTAAPPAGSTGSTGTAPVSGPASSAASPAPRQPAPASGVGDSRSDDPSDDAPDGGEP